MQRWKSMKIMIHLGSAIKIWNIGLYKKCRCITLMNYKIEDLWWITAQEVIPITAHMMEEKMLSSLDTSIKRICRGRALSNAKVSTPRPTGWVEAEVDWYKLMNEHLRKVSLEQAWRSSLNTIRLFQTPIVSHQSQQSQLQLKIRYWAYKSISLTAIHPQMLSTAAASSSRAPNTQQTHNFL